MLGLDPEEENTWFPRNYYVFTILCFAHAILSYSCVFFSFLCFRNLRLVVFRDWIKQISGAIVILMVGMSIKLQSYTLQSETHIDSSRTNKHNNAKFGNAVQRSMPTSAEQYLTCAPPQILIIVPSTTNPPRYGHQTVLQWDLMSNITFRLVYFNSHGV